MAVRKKIIKLAVIRKVDLRSSLQRRRDAFGDKVDEKFSLVGGEKTLGCRINLFTRLGILTTMSFNGRSRSFCLSDQVRSEN